MTRLTYIFIILLCISGCRRYDIDEILLQREDISLTINGVEVISYDPVSYQLGYNERKNEFWVSDDYISHWFILTCHDRPDTEEQSLKADLSWTDATTTKSRKNLNFKVMKRDSKGHIWLWCEEDAIGIVVKEFRQ